VGKGKGYLTIKGETRGATRQEFEYEIPVAEADALLDGLCERPLIEKVRYEVVYGGLTWEVDEFYGDNEGLVIAEVELTSEEQMFEKPDWVGQEVTGDARYYNVNLAKWPYKAWGGSRQ
jgi:adenylate cyclase